MRITLTPARKRTLAILSLVCGVLYAGEAAREFVASLLGGRVHLTSLKIAAMLDPGNADYRYHLGRYFDLVVRDPLTAVGYYEAATRLNPHSARFWFDLASAYQVLGNTAKQTAALEHAIQADAMTPDVAWEAANLYLVQGENEKALREFSVVLANDPGLPGIAIQLCWRLDPDVDSLLRDVVPHTVEAYTAFLELLEKNRDVPGSFKVWSALLQTRETFLLRTAKEYMEFLVQQKAIDQAVMVWEEVATRFGLTTFLPTSDNLMVNPKFDMDPLNLGFDWHYEKMTGVTLNLDPTAFHAGRRSLMISFDGPGITDAGFYQFVAVRPGVTYDFSAYYKNGDFDGAGGPHLTVQDVYTQAVYYESPELKDADDWKSAEGQFTTGPECRLIVVHIRRLPAGSPIRGKLWIDDFHLSRKPS
jgi:tetratricopeptide (TPR) repeat protein